MSEMDPQLRASDAEREDVVERMREQVGAGRLTLEEFSERAADAYRARTVGELAALTRDLPNPRRSPLSAAPRLPIVLAAALLALVALVVTGLSAADSMSSMMSHMGSMHP